MALSHSKYIDARQSCFNEAGRDWHQTHNDNTTIHDLTIHNHTYFSLLGSRRTSRRAPVDLSDNLPRPICSPERHQTHNSTSVNPKMIHINVPLFDRSQQTPHHVLVNLSGNQPRLIPPLETLTRGSPVAYHLSDTVAAVDTATGLIDQITIFLLDRRNSSNNRQDLALELESLHQTLDLTKTTIQKYDDTPLGQSIANMITPKVKLCSIALQQLLGSIDITRLGLSFTIIGDLWRQVWWAMLGRDEFASLRKNVSYSRQSLQNLLVTMHSVAWMELGNELRTGLATLRRFHRLNPQIPSLYHIKLNAVDVVSHLGDVIPIPTIFCSTWKDFDYVVRVHCRDRAGTDLIKRGDYQVIRSEDYQIVGPSELASMEPGMTLEMTIVLRQGAAFQDTKEKCPRCGYINVKATADHGWIQCRNCSGKFQIAEADLINRNEQNDPRGGDEHRAKVDRERNRACHPENGDEDIISSAPLPNDAHTIGKERWRDDNGTYDDGGTHFFRRIHVICMNNGSVSNTGIGDEACVRKADFQDTVQIGRTVTRSSGTEVSNGDIIIAVMGATGVGKSSFINMAVGNDRTIVGHHLRSCTQGVQAVWCSDPDNPGRKFVFLDTPGFDDTHRSDTQILMDIAEWLKTTYQRGIMLSGLLFPHRISDNRMTGTSLRSTHMFEMLCGAGALQNVILVTTMWGEVDKLAGPAREQALKTQFWKSMIASGSRMARFDHTYESAWTILGQFTGVRRPLRLQVEMVDQGKSLGRTAAGLVLLQWLEYLVTQFETTIIAIRRRLGGTPKCSKIDTELLRDEFAAQQGLNRATEQIHLLDSERLEKTADARSPAYDRKATVVLQPGVVTGAQTQKPEQMRQVAEFERKAQERLKEDERRRAEELHAKKLVLREKFRENQRRSAEEAERQAEGRRRAEAEAVRLRKGNKRRWRPH